MIDTNRVREILRQRHEFDEKLEDPNLVSTQALQIALTCDLIDAMRIVAGEVMDRKRGCVTVDVERLGIDPYELHQVLERLARDRERARNTYGRQYVKDMQRNMGAKTWMD